MLVDLTSTRAGRCATVEYPSIPCSAEWICTRFEGGVLEARERLTGDSAGRCVDAGAMRMRIVEDGSLDWRWQRAPQSASATLRRPR
jgi:hypothetical protein